MVKKGSPLMTLQPGWTIDEDEHGLLTGECSWEGDAAYAGGILAGGLHPYDPRLTGYRRRLTKLSTGKARVTIGYIGITADPTRMFIEHPGGSAQDPIETHPDFLEFAGSAAEPKNGAVFDEDTGEFLGFMDPDYTEVGTRSYIVPSVMVNLTYYSHFVPNINNAGRIYYFSVPDFVKPPNVRDFLLLGVPYKKIGNLYQITHQLLGSGPRGWNRKIY